MPICSSVLSLSSHVANMANGLLANGCGKVTVIVCAPILVGGNRSRSVIIFKDSDFVSNKSRYRI